MGNAAPWAITANRNQVKAILLKFRPGSWAALVVLLVCVSPAAGQTVSSTIRGKVTDLSDQGIPGVRIVAVETGTSFSREALTGPNGRYQISLLRPGTYRVSAELPGYGRGMQRDAGLGLQATLVVNFQLPPALEEHIQVSGAPALLDLNTTALVTRLNRATIESTPIDGRNFLSLALLDSSIESPAGGFFSAGEELVYSVNGAGGRANSFLVDGSSNNDLVFGTAANARFPMLALQEYVVLKGGYGAEFGRASGGVFNVITRSGTNRLSGTAFYDLSNASLNNRVEFSGGTPDGPLSNEGPERQQFGFSLGGPLVKNKAFFFAAYESGRVDDIGFFTGTDRDGNAGGYFEQSRDSERVFLKTEFHLTPAQILTARISYADDTRRGVNIQGRFTTDTGSSIHQENFQAYLSLKSIFSPTFFNEARLLFSNSDGTQTANSDNPGVERPGGIFGGDDLNRREQQEVQFQFVDNITWIHGNHSLKFGVDITRVNVDITTAFNPNGTYVYTTDEPFEGGDNGLGFKGNSVAASGIGIPGVDDDGDGVIDEVRILETYPLVYRLLEGKPSISVNDTVLALFVQDEWRVRDNVMLHFGLRYDLESFELDEQYAVESTIDNGGAGNDTDNVAPRFSFSWLPAGSGKVLMRGGIGMFYDKVVLGFPSIAAITSGQTIRLGFFQGLGFPCNEDFLEKYGVDVVRTQCGLLDLDIESLSLRFSTGDTMDTPYTVQANIGFDYSSGNGLLFGLNFVHARGHHIPLFRDLNPIIGEGVVPGLPRHADDSVGSIVAIETMGNTWYDALEAQLRRTKGLLRYTVSYTYSKAEDDGSDPLMNRATLPPDSSDIAGERARTDSDRRHRLVLVGTWNIPRWGLKISPVVNYRSGAPFNVTLGIDDNAVNLADVDTQGRLLPDGFAQERPPGLGRNTGANTPISLVNEIREAWCNDTVMVDGFAEPTPQLATPCLPAYDGILKEESFIQVDLRVTRAFDMGDSQLEAFVQIFNVFNRANRSNVDGAINSRNFGKPLNVVGPPRIVEMGVRFGF